MAGGEHGSIRLSVENYPATPVERAMKIEEVLLRATSSSKRVPTTTVTQLVNARNNLIDPDWHTRLLGNFAKAYTRRQNGESHSR